MEISGTLKTFGGWVAIAGGLYWYFWGRNGRRGSSAPRRGPSTNEKQAFKEQVGKGKKKKGTNGDANASGSATGSSSEKPRSTGKSTKKESTVGDSYVDIGAGESSTGKKSKDADSDDRAFAAQLQKTQQGTTLKSKEKSSQRVKTTKQAKANQAEEETSSNTTGDADDDLSSQSQTPEPKEATFDPTGVADMLEKPASGPASIRIIPAKEPQRKQPVAPKKEVEVETKKQRQRRKKNEERKSAMAESELERKKLAQQQMRTARVADGTSKSQAALKAPGSNAWSKTEPAKEKVSAPETQAALLDTFEPGTVTEATPAKSNDAGSEDFKPSSTVNGGEEHKSTRVNGKSTSDAPKSQDQPSSNITGEWEEIPDNILNDNDGWEAAVSKKGKKNQKKAAAAGTATSESG